ncbi:8273_t:CDS:10, partial [Entrophospora sp. SA101]
GYILATRIECSLKMSEVIKPKLKSRLFNRPKIQLELKCGTQNAFTALSELKQSNDDKTEKVAVWDEHIFFNLSSKDDELVIYAYNHLCGGAESRLGKAVINFNNLKKKRPIKVTEKLIHTDGDNINGRVEFYLYFLAKLLIPIYTFIIISVDLYGMNGLMEFMLNDKERHSTKKYWRINEKHFKGHIALRVNTLNNITLLIQCRHSDGKLSSRKIILSSDTEDRSIWEKLKTSNPYLEETLQMNGIEYAKISFQLSFFRMVYPKEVLCPPTPNYPHPTNQPTTPDSTIEPNFIDIQSSDEFDNTDNPFDDDDGCSSNMDSRIEGQSFDEDNGNNGSGGDYVTTSGGNSSNGSRSIITTPSPPPICEDSEQVIFDAFVSDDLIQGSHSQIYQTKVFRGHHTLTKDAVIMKSFASKNYFSNEVYYLQKLRSAHVVKFITSDEDEYLSIVEDFGRALAKEAHKFNDTISIFKVFKNICAAVKHCHDKGVVHMNISPSNIICKSKKDEIDKIRLIDFKLSKDLGEDLQIELPSSSPSFLNNNPYNQLYSVGYTCPELILLNPPLMFASNQYQQQSIKPGNICSYKIKVKTTIDVFSLGAILFFLHVKRPLYESVKKLKSSLDNLNKVLDQEDIENQVVRSLIVGCCKFKEDERISSVDKIFELIERIERESDLGGYNMDRRLDEWVSHEKISPITKSPNPTITSKNGNDNRANKRRKTASEKEQGVKVRQTDSVVIGEHEIKCWYDSPYPDPYKNLNKLYVYCPGKLIYEKNKIRMYEVDGKDSKLYCQNLSLLTKLFIDDKSVYFDVEPFMFYIITEMDARGIEHFVGFFSKEKISYDNYNLACVLILPPFQKHGYGKLLIEASYEFSKRENKIGSPEKPISDLGLMGFRSYWKRTIFDLIQNYINSAPYHTAISEDDVLDALKEMGFLKYKSPKLDSTYSPKLKRKFDKMAKEHTPAICITESMIDEYAKSQGSKRQKTMLDPDSLDWTPANAGFIGGGSICVVGVLLKSIAGIRKAFVDF